MSESLSDAVRDAAEKEAFEEFRYKQFSMTHPIAFIRGAVWAVGRLPSRDEIAAVFTSRREPEYQIPEQEDFDDADAVLALIRETVAKGD